MSVRIKGMSLKNKHRIYIQYYNSIYKGEDNETAFDKRIAGLYKKLREGRHIETHEKTYANFF